MKKTSVTIILTIMLAVVMVGSYAYFSNCLAVHLRESTETRLKENVTPNLVSFELQMQEQMKKVDTFAQYLGEVGQLGDADQIKLLQAAVKYNGLLRCAIAFPDGSFVTHDQKNEGDVASAPFFVANMRGEHFVTDPQPAIVDPSKTVILFSAPIYKENTIIGSVIYSYLCHDMDKIFNLNFLEGNGKLAIVKSSGLLLMGGDDQDVVGENLVESLRSTCTHKHHAPDSCLAIDCEQGSSTLTFSNLDSPLLVRYDKLNYNDWYMISMVQERAAAGTIYTVYKDQQKLGIILISVILVYVFLLTIFWLYCSKRVDKLTGALTLEGFKRIAHKYLRRMGARCFVMVKLDVRNFKLINRVYSFELGDEVIRNISQALNAVLGPVNGLYARIGTDDFVLLLPYENRESLDKQRETFVREFYRLMGEQFTTRIEFPTGQYIITEEEFPQPNVSEALEKANFAHRAAKLGDWGNHIVDYVENLEKEALLEKAIEDKMVSALDNKEFQLYLQPKYDTCSETVCGAEALVRWEVNGEYVMHPTAFIPILERNGFIVKIDKYMFEQAVLRIRSFLDRGIEPVTISVNFSRVHLMNDSFVEELCVIADQYNVPHKYLEIELTESAVFENVERIIQLINQLHGAGFTMSMDDFGSGYSCLALLKELKVDVLKLDKGFFDVCDDPKRAQIVISNIMNMARQLGVVTVAEGIETFSQVELLRELGCDMIQGYYYAKPLPAERFKL